MSIKKKTKRSNDYNLSDVYEEDYKNKDKGSGGNRANYLDLSEYPDLEFYKIKKGKNKISILQYRITTDNHPKGREKGKTDYKLEVFVHRFFGESEGNYLCMKETFNKSCPGCKEVKKMIDSKEYTWKDKEVKDMRPQHREVFIIQDLMEDEDKYYLFDSNHWEFQKELLAEAERDEDGFVPFADLEEGKAIIFYGEEREGEFKNTTYKPTGFRFRDREPIDSDVVDEVPSLDALLVIPDYEEMEKDLYGISSGDDDDDEKPKSKKKSSKRRDYDDDDEEEEDDDEYEDDSDDEEEDTDDDYEEDIDDDFQSAIDRDDDDDDDEPAPKKSKKKARKPVDEDEDDDEEPPKKSKPVKTRKGKAPEKKTTKTKSKNKCPNGYEFGEDCDEKPKCKKCELWDECSEAYGQ